MCSWLWEPRAGSTLDGTAHRLLARCTRGTAPRNTFIPSLIMHSKVYIKTSATLYEGKEPARPQEAAQDGRLCSHRHHPPARTKGGSGATRASIPYNSPGVGLPLGSSLGLMHRSTEWKKSHVVFWRNPLKPPQKKKKKMPASYDTRDSRNTAVLRSRRCWIGFLSIFAQI